MLWRIGWLLNTLNYQIEKNLHESIYGSEPYKKHEWNWIESQVMHWSRSPASSILRIGVAITALLVAANLFEANIYPLQSGVLYQWNWLYGWQTTLLSVQATLVGVVLPLAISLVGFLLQRKTASKAIWSLYRQYSGFLFIGFSGLTSLVFIISGLYFETATSWVSYTLWCVISFLWVSFNIFLIGWFIRATFLIVHEPSRDSLLLRYAINESFTLSVKKRISQIVPGNYIAEEITPILSGSGLDVSIMRYSQENEILVKAKFNKEKYVVGIRFRILKVALFLAGKQAKSIEGKKQIVVPLSTGDAPRKQQILASCSNYNPNFLVRILLRFSYIFSSEKLLLDEVLDDILFAWIGTASDELRDRNPVLFERSVNKLAIWHCEVSDALAFINDKKEIDNWLLLPSSNIWSRTFLDEILTEYYKLTQQVVETIPESLAYFKAMIHMQVRISSWRKEELPERIEKELINSSYLTWTTLVRWGSSVEKSPGTLIHNQYNSSILSYVGVWESWPMLIEPRSNRMKEGIRSLPLFQNHLICTAQQIVTAVRYGERTAAEWAVDMMLNWFSTVDPYDHPSGKYIWNHELITTNLVGRDSSANIWQFILKGYDFEERSAAQLALENAWFDLRLMTAAYIQANRNERSATFLTELVESLIGGKRLKPTGCVEKSSDQIRTGGDLLAVYIRQRCYFEHNGASYGVWLDSIVDAFSRIDEPELVSGRIYSGIGIDGVKSLDNSYVKLAITKSENTWSLPTRWIDIIFSPVYEQRHRDNLLGDLREWLRIAEDDIESDNTSCTIERISNFKSSVNNLISQVSNRQLDTVRAADIDRTRLLNFGIAASKSGFSSASGGVLIRLFNQIHFTNSTSNAGLHEVRIRDYSKSGIAEGVEVNRAINEDEWIDDVVNQHVSFALFSKLCSQPQSVETKFDSNIDLVKRISSDILQFSDELGEMTVFIGQWSIYRILNDALFDKDAPVGLNIERREGYGGSYICHLEGSAVYRLPYQDEDFSLLVPNAAFDSVTFRKFSQDRLVDVEVEDLNDVTLKLTLVFKYYMDVHFSEKPIYRYISSKNDDE